MVMPLALTARSLNAARSLKESISCSEYHKSSLCLWLRFSMKLTSIESSKETLLWKHTLFLEGTGASKVVALSRAVVAVLVDPRDSLFSFGGDAWGKSTMRSMLDTSGYQIAIGDLDSVLIENENKRSD